MNEIKKSNELSDEQLKEVSGGNMYINDLFPHNYNPEEALWIVIETGERTDASGKYSYLKLYNRETGQTREERCYEGDPWSAG